MGQGSPDEPASGALVEQPAAAALAIRRQVLDRLGGFDEQFYPAWFEDVDLAKRLQQERDLVRSWPEAVLNHKLGSSVVRLVSGFAAPSRPGITAASDPPTDSQTATGRLSHRRSEGSDGTGPGFLDRVAWFRERRPFATIVTGETRDCLMTAPSPKVTVCIVAYDSAEEIPACLTSIARSTYRPLEVVLVDCASRDGSAAVARQAKPANLPLEIVELTENLGFAGGMNRALERSDSPWVLSLNPDTRPTPDYLQRLLTRARDSAGDRVGAVTGRLHRFGNAGEVPILDACGMRLTLTWRHLDRGSGEMDTGQWSTADQVFGATGAASLFSRQALDDVAIDGEVFASEFHSFREDAELCFRLRERGWKVVYEPLARCDHRRQNLPSRRREMPPEVNFHSLKNRYLLRAYHQDSINLLLTLAPTLLRDLTAMLYVVAFERSSIEAYRWLWRHRREILERRRLLKGRRLCSSWELNRWFFRRGMPV